MIGMELYLVKNALDAEKLRLISNGRQLFEN